MKLLITGDFKRTYNRNQIIIKGLQRIGVDVLEMPYEKRKSLDIRALRAAAESADAVFLPAFKHSEVGFIRRKLPRKTIVFDPLISKYLTKVFDYQRVSPYSIRALKNFLKDKRAFERADIVLADTYAHKAYFETTFRIRPEKIRVLHIGNLSDAFYPLEKATHQADPKTVTVGFYGSFAPLQGVEKIVRAAGLLKGHENIIFEIIGSGFDYEKVQSLVRQEALQNIRFREWAPYDVLNARINAFDFCLGIFGDSLKTQLVIPNKIFHYAGCGKAVITRDTPAVREVFTDQQDIILCDGEPESIAENILTLAGDPGKRRQIGDHAHRLISTHYDEKNVARRLREIIMESAKTNPKPNENDA